MEFRNRKKSGNQTAAIPEYLKLFLRNLFFVDKSVDNRVDNLWIKKLSTSYPQTYPHVIHKFFNTFIFNIMYLKSYPHIHIDDHFWNILVLNFITWSLWITLKTPP